MSKTKIGSFIETGLSHPNIKEKKTSTWRLLLVDICRCLWTWFCASFAPRVYSFSCRHNNRAPLTRRVVWSDVIQPTLRGFWGGNARVKPSYLNTRERRASSMLCNLEHLGLIFPTLGKDKKKLAIPPIHPSGQEVYASAWPITRAFVQEMAKKLGVMRKDILSSARRNERPFSLVASAV